MLNFRNTNYLFFFLLLVAVIFFRSAQNSFLIFVLLVLVYSLVLFYGCYVIRANFFIPVHCTGNTAEKIMALTFDDGPDAAGTPEILKVLEQYQVKATFFCIGKNINGNEKLLRQIRDEGHLIGNHSYSHHFWFDLFPVKKMLADLQQTDDAIEEVTGHRPALFRPPYGVTNPNVAATIRRGKYVPVGWDIRSMDTFIKAPEQLLSKVKKALHPGAILLFHDTMKVTAEILPELIRFAKAEGYTFVRVDELLDVELSAT